MLKEFQKYLDMNSTHALDMCDVFFDFTLLDNARGRMIEIKKCLSEFDFEEASQINKSLINELSY